MTGEQTTTVPPPPRRRRRLAIALAGAIAFLATAAVITLAALLFQPRPARDPAPPVASPTRRSGGYPPTPAGVAEALYRAGNRFARGGDPAPLEPYLNPQLIAGWDPGSWHRFWQIQTRSGRVVEIACVRDRMEDAGTGPQAVVTLSMVYREGSRPDPLAPEGRGYDGPWMHTDVRLAPADGRWRVEHLSRPHKRPIQNERPCAIGAAPTSEP